MQILENLISAFSVLRGSKLRTVLTLLGITIGIAGVIAMIVSSARVLKNSCWHKLRISVDRVCSAFIDLDISKRTTVGNAIRDPHYLEMRDLHDILAECPSVEVATVERSHPIDFEVEGKHRRHLSPRHNE